MATVRVQPGTHATLRALSAAEQRPMGQVIEDAIDLYQRETFWTVRREGFTQSRADRDSWAEYRSEAVIWDSVAGDGLEGEGPYFSGQEKQEDLGAKTTNTTR